MVTITRYVTVPINSEPDVLFSVRAFTNNLLTCYQDSD